MGLLDDAIREHLELKRRAGADPGEIARTENEALAPVVPAVDSAQEDVAVAQEGEEPHAGTDGQAGERTAEGTDFDHVGEETAELDMQAVLDAQDEVPREGIAGAALPADDGATLPASARSAQEDSLEWEVPGEGRDAPPPEIPGQEKLAFE
jgi:hypothetical protein